jgi:hypothetical protein
MASGAAYVGQFPAAGPTVANSVQLWGTAGAQAGTFEDPKIHAVTFSPVPVKIGASTATLGTSAISSGACASVVTVSSTGVATTDTITWVPNANLMDPSTGVTGYKASASGMLTVQAYPTSNNVNFLVCNNTGASITPGSAVVLNWAVYR